MPSVRDRDPAALGAAEGARSLRKGTLLPSSYAELRTRGQIVVEAEAAAYHAENFAEHADDHAPGIAAGIHVAPAR